MWSYHQIRGGSGPKGIHTSVPPLHISTGVASWLPSTLPAHSPTVISGIISKGFPNTQSRFESTVVPSKSTSRSSSVTATLPVTTNSLSVPTVTTFGMTHTTSTTLIVSSTQSSTHPSLLSSPSSSSASVTYSTATPTPSHSTSAAAATNTRSSHLGAIIGGVVGGVAFIFVLAILALLRWNQRKHQAAARQTTFNGDMMVEPPFD
ncbi:hypothetical protein J3R30DRAFT_54190 [Lentinula aciculospora]|uniref:Mid2 domain-containing protein n=1 Tax=Lentinula aciculospora TaxID=153920 RepID=A0A9W9DY00_9AGAR|nr:hypothetical protein J3R30DRAFT_54190 [Lentinula aciculospora]